RRASHTHSFLERSKPLPQATSPMDRGKTRSPRSPEPTASHASSRRRFSVSLRKTSRHGRKSGVARGSMPCGHWHNRRAGSPQRLLGLDGGSLTAVIRLCADAAASNAKAAQRLLELVPAAIARLAPPRRMRLVAACAHCRSLDALADAMALLGAVLHGIGEADVDFLLDKATHIAAAAPLVLPSFLRTMDHAIDEGGQPGVELWVERGIELATQG